MPNDASSVAARRQHAPREVHPVGHDVNALGRDAPRGHDRCDGPRDRDHRVCAAVLEARSEVPAQRKVHAPGDDEPHRSANTGERGDGGGVSRMRMHYVRAASHNRAPEACGREHVELTVRNEAIHLESRARGAPGKLVVLPSDDDRPVTALPHPGREPENLALPATPPSLRVDVQNRQHRSARTVTSSTGTADRCTS